MASHRTTYHTLHLTWLTVTALILSSPIAWEVRNLASVDPATILAILVIASSANYVTPITHPIYLKVIHPSFDS
jgi:hypothetical protein